LAEEAMHDYQVSGQYGFLPQHAILPPTAQWGFDYVEGAWDSDNESFSEANFSHILLTPGNFIQWQGPTENYPMENTSPAAATIEILNWCIQQEDSLKIHIYENWPDMGGYLSNGFPPTLDEWTNYNAYLNNDFHNWFLEYHDILTESIDNTCVKMIPTGPIISHLLNISPYNNIEITTLYEDDAPHGRPTIYFLASLISYMAMYEEKAPSNFQVESIIDPIIADNYNSVVDIIWNELNNFRFENGESRVFCTLPSTSDIAHLDLDSKIKISPNPIYNTISINSEIQSHSMNIYDLNGKTCLPNSILIDTADQELNISFLPSGLYYIIGKDEFNNILYRKKVIKI